MRVESAQHSRRESTQPEDVSETADAQGTTDQKAFRSGSKPTAESSSVTARKASEITARLSPILPAGKVFPIRIGAELFQLSGASISSDAPSCFSHYFGEQLLQSGGKASSVKTLYIDRDASTFQDIVRHLQGYHIKPRDGAHYVRLFADAQFYSLPRLTQQLFKSEIFVQVGERHFQIPRDIFSAPGDSPNYFSLGFAHYFSSPLDSLPANEGQALLRPPSIQPPVVPNRDGDIFAELIHLLQGYDIEIRDETHRNKLLRDARYFHLKGLEQKLLPFEKSFNLGRQRYEIVMRLEDLRQSGVIFTPDPDSTSGQAPADLSKPATPHSIMGGNVDSGASRPMGWISYQRPFVDENTSDLVVDITGPRESIRLDPKTLRVTFYGEVRARITSLFQVIANKMGLPATLPLGLMMIQSGGGVAAQPVSPANSGVSGDRVKVRFERDSWVEVDGKELDWDDEDEDEGDDEDYDSCPNLKEPADQIMERDWVVKRSLWRLTVVNSSESGKPEVVMVVVKVEAITDQRSRNRKRGFISS
ncbi:hypothetical protein BT63DRAFT_368119 [Microthyrium microscopicum]|uniref:Potassium channel tetramerisation-type BTB domain-containing protein n=1 Tax=Microthyrium microscopicum TaxID=703497 RepID=A0A6A6UMI5_9PEZI|nr:hypothetical protein BT63DRAFT_368119 [Microthyrium microscopicum]